jgi:YHS domain-containing protein
MRIIGGITILVAALALGCSKKEEAKPSGPAANPAAGIAQLSPADQKLAEAQGVCPVSGKELGSMGKPVRIEYQGTVLFLCCPHCEPTFEADPAKYLAKLKK